MAIEAGFSPVGDFMGSCNSRHSEQHPGPCCAKPLPRRHAEVGTLGLRYISANEASFRFDEFGAPHCESGMLASYSAG